MAVRALKVFASLDNFLNALISVTRFSSLACLFSVRFSPALRLLMFVLIIIKEHNAW